jgi:hypothetical protein
MAVLHWSQCPAVERIPGMVSGAVDVQGHPSAVTTVIENLEDGVGVCLVTTDPAAVCRSVPGRILKPATLTS